MFSGAEETGRGTMTPEKWLDPFHCLWELLNISEAHLNILRHFSSQTAGDKIGCESLIA